MKTKDRVLEAMHRELKNNSLYFGGEAIETIYFGGGTPSILEAQEIRNFLELSREIFPTTPEMEITLEANPDDLSVEKLSELKRAGINRLSIGIQSFNEEALQFMNRSHNVSQALACIHSAKEIGFQNITIDLIYGVPNQSAKQWERNVDQAIRLDVPHISSYCLTVESKTALDHLVRKGEISEVSEDEVQRQNEYLHNALERAGFEHYEISNFSKPGFRSIHNSSYWKGNTYLGIGPSAHSFNGTNRQWNIANNVQYCMAIENNSGAFSVEELSTSNRCNEYIMTGLRTAQGINLNHILLEHDYDLMAMHRKYIQGLIDAGLAIIEKDDLSLTRAGWMVSDGICSRLFIEKT